MGSEWMPRRGLVFSACVPAVPSPRVEHAIELRLEELDKTDIIVTSGPDSRAAIGAALERIRGVPDEVIFNGDPRELGSRPH